MTSPGATFEKTEATLRFLMRAFRAVLDDVGASEVATLLPWRDRWDDTLEGQTTPQRTLGSPFPPEIAEASVQAYSIAFQLLNKAEENATAQSRRLDEKAGELSDDSGSWDQMLERARSQGATVGQLCDVLARTRIEPVLTAHPTEAKRQTVLEHHRQIYRLLVELENTMWTHTERSELEREVEACLERLWRTGEIYLEKPSLADERRGVLHYLAQVFPDVLPWFVRRLRSAWERAGLDLEHLAHPRHLPKVVFGDWVGGDRDGHPGVTADITTETLSLFRSAALDMLDKRLRTLAVRLSLSQLRQPTPPSLLERITTLSTALGDTGRAAVERNPDEPWRQYINLLRAALPRDQGEGRFSRSQQLVDELEQLRGSLHHMGAQRLARSDVDPLILLVQAFGFHLATLDVRQNSAFHDRALAQLLHIAGIEGGAEYPNWDLSQRRALLEAELATRRPFASPRDVESGEAQAVLEVYRRLAKHWRRYGREGLGGLIVSMTRSVEDLLAVYVLARDGGLLANSDEGPWCPLEVVPLFETIDDLERAPDIMDAYLTHPVVQNSLRRRQSAEGTPEPVQQVMIGYSDSSKDGGIVCSFWSLYRGQSRLAEVGRKHHVRIRFFHGRGGTIGRGAGPTHRFVKALPPRTVGGDLRLTEQGETIAQKYANKVTAAHHLELLSAGAMHATVADNVGRADPPELLALMDELARDSRLAYRDLLEADGFVAFFGQATPLDVIEASRIGSRPARRSGKRTLDDLRAIPWVFAWNQSRFVLPGWYGLGSALMGLREREPERFALLLAAKREQTRWDPWHYLISNAATAWMTSSPDVMACYAQLVADEATRENIMSRVRKEHALTQEALEALYEGPLAIKRAGIHRLLCTRDVALRPLHDHQMDLLTRWRGYRAAEDHDAASQLLPELLLTVNAIASGLGATG